MGIPKRMMVTIAGLGFAGATALLIGVAGPAAAATPGTSAAGTSTVTSAPTFWGCGCWDDCWGDCWGDCW
jgi:hypothetical protein